MEFQFKPTTLRSSSRHKNTPPRFRHTVWLAAALTAFLFFPPAAALFITPARAVSGTAEVSVVSNSGQSADTEELRDIRPPMGYDFFAAGRWRVAALALGAAFLAYLWLRRRSSREEPAAEPAPPPVPPETAARDALRELDASGILESGNFKEYYVRLSRIIRAYTGGALNFNCVDMYTDEALAQLSALGTARGHILAFEAVSRECDMVKFAKFVPSVEDARRVRASVENFINLTAGAGFR